MGTVSGSRPGAEAKRVETPIENSDQSEYNLGIRDLVECDSMNGKFVEFETCPLHRRDPEESRYDEAGAPVITQGDIEMKKLSKSAGKQGNKT